MAIGPTQIIVLVLIVVLLFGASRISELGKGLGLGIKNFKKGLSDDEEDEAADEDDSKQLKGKQAGNAAAEPAEEKKENA